MMEMTIARCALILGEGKFDGWIEVEKSFQLAVPIAKIEVCMAQGKWGNEEVEDDKKELIKKESTPFYNI